mgnify:CR=1 FL=1
MNWKREIVFFLHILDKTLAYKVDQVRVIKPEELEQLQTYHDKDYVTLLTCTPYGVNTHRLLVRGERIPYEVAEEMGEAFDDERIRNAAMVKEYVVMIIAGILAACFRRQDVCGEKIKEPQNRRKEDYCSAVFTISSKLLRRHL